MNYLKDYRRLAGLNEDSKKCPYGGYLVEELLKYDTLLSTREGPEYEEFWKNYTGSTPFFIDCACGKRVKTMLRGNNWRVPSHKTP